jgi:hypothetical protein
MISKLRIQPYAPQWEQEGRDISFPRSPIFFKNDQETENSALCSIVGARGEIDYPPKESYLL